MTLDKWLKANKTSTRKFATLIGVTQPSASRYRRGLRIPSPEIMARIKQQTHGQVTADDFYPSLPRLRRR